MRQFATFVEAQNELKRELAELGIRVHPETMQDIDVANDPDFDTMELTNYVYTVLKPIPADLEGVHWKWVEQEWEDRLTGDLNPGHAWRKRKEVWQQFIEGQFAHKGYGKFAYSYSERMGGHKIQMVIDELMIHPHSRQLWLPVWNMDDAKRRGKRRVPCTLGYWFVRRGSDLHVTYVMRSCDFITHWANDVSLATMLMRYIADEAHVKPGTFTQFVGSLHMYRKDAEGVF